MPTYQIITKSWGDSLQPPEPITSSVTCAADAVYSNLKPEQWIINTRQLEGFVKPQQSGESTSSLLSYLLVKSPSSLVSIKLTHFQLASIFRSHSETIPLQIYPKQPISDTLVRLVEFSIPDRLGQAVSYSLNISVPPTNWHQVPS